MAEQSLQKFCIFVYFARELCWFFSVVAAIKVQCTYNEAGCSGEKCRSGAEYWQVAESIEDSVIEQHSDD